MSATRQTASALCVTGGERTVAGLAARLAAQRGALQEARLDLLEDLDGSAFELLGDPRLIVACRSRAEGGAFAGSEDERAAVLRRALAARPGWLDVELSAAPALRRELLASRGSTRLLLSCHALQPGGDPAALAARLSAEEADALKLAIAVEDAAELAPLRAAGAGEARPFVRVGMGAAGLLSRVLPARFGSPWTYVAADGATPTAPGQLSLSTARAWRVGEALAPVALLGGAAVLTSPGPRVYNRLFAARALPLVYLPLLTARPADALALLEALGSPGASVTMPLKERVLTCLDAVSAAALQVGAVNTVRLAAGRRLGSNSDALAARELLAPHRGRRALVLGAGGAARACLVALRELGCPARVSARDDARAAALAGALAAEALPWARRGEAGFELLVNATPCGRTDEEDPLPAGAPLTGRCVLELVIRDGEGTPLARRARAQGAELIDGLAFWTAQGARQLGELLGLELTAAELRGLVEEREGDTGGSTDG